LSLIGCGSHSNSQQQASDEKTLPQNSFIFFEEEAKLSEESFKQTLLETGQRLFFDKQLSFNQTKSCSSCHDPALSFSDGYRRSLGATADLHLRNSPSLLNVGDNSNFTSASKKLVKLSEQLLQPLFNTSVIEMGVTGHENTVLDRINSDAFYKTFREQLAAKQLKLDFNNLVKALEAYCLSLKSYNSKYDKFLRKETRLTASEERGRKLFFSKTLKCSSCHSGLNLNFETNSYKNHFRNNGFMQNLISHSDKEKKEDLGLFGETSSPSDVGKFRVPSLRNVMKTAPYMHDGSIANIEEVIEIYSKGGINKANIDPLISGFPISNKQKKDLIAFLNTLTDLSYLNNPHFLAPLDKF
jgi:cytochrome c peroxidase